MKKIVSFLNNGWVNFVVGLFLCVVVGCYMSQYEDSLHWQSFVSGIWLFVSTDIMGYGISTLLAGRRKKKGDTSSSE